MNLVMYSLLGLVLDAGGITVTQHTDMWLSIVALVVMIDAKPWENWNSDDDEKKPGR